MNPFIEQVGNTLIKIDSKVIYIVTKDLFFKLILFYWNFYSSKNP